MIIILAICFGTAFSGYAERSTSLSMPVTAIECLNEQTGEYDLNHKPLALLSRVFSRRTALTHRHLSYTRFIDLFLTVLFPKQPVILQNFYEPGLYFKPIALKLVFPEHYFW